MGIEICPLAADWGNWADWAGVMVAAAGALAVFWLGVSANRMSNESLRINNELKVAAEELRDREARLLARLLLPEISIAANGFSGILAVLECGDSHEELEARAGWRNGLQSAIRGMDLPTCRQNFERLHLLPEEVCGGVATSLTTVESTWWAVDVYHRYQGKELDAVAFASVQFAARHSVDRLSSTEKAIEQFLGLNSA